MTPTDLFYYVIEGAITPPPARTVFAGGFEQTRNPFPRPNAIGSVQILAVTNDAVLASYNVYRLWAEDRGAAPDLGYYEAAGPLVVDIANQRVTRTDSWVQMTAEEYADALQEAKREKVEQLKVEANTRFAAVNDWIDNIDAYQVLEAIVLMIKPAARDPAPQLLLDIKAIADAGRDARTAIIALTTLEQVAAYNVETDPAWP